MKTSRIQYECRSRQSSQPFSSVCACARAQAHKPVGPVCAWMCERAGQRLIATIFPLLLSTLILVFETRSLWTWCSRIQQDCLASELKKPSFVLPAPLPPCWGSRIHCYARIFHVGSRYPNSGPHACAVVTLPTDTSPAPVHLFSLKYKQKSNN